jgi:hypothetical protein
MIAVVTVLLAFPLGYFVRSRSAANTAYAIAYLWAFTYQSFYLVLDIVDGQRDAASPEEFPWQYGVVTLAVFGVGFGLVALGRRTRTRRADRLDGRPSTQRPADGVGTSGEADPARA